MEGAVEKLALGLAGLYHDPPWKPWAILGAISGDEKAGGTLERVLVACRRTDVCPESVAQQVKDLSALVELEHEKHALILPLVIAYRLQKEGAPIWLVDSFTGAAGLIAGKGSLAKVLREGDREASAIDRIELYEALKKKGLHRTVYSRRLRLVNPFMPVHKLELPEGIDAERIARFINGYTSLLVEALKSICRGKNEESDAVECAGRVLTAAYLLLEPSWYYYTESTPDKPFAPPADTRIPTHTVFDHADSVMSVLLLLQGGCLAIVDLAGVQSWIGESRRLRDLWAASWLASYLAWRAVEPLVERHGPGVLVSPPGRLNPFLATRILGKWLQEIAEDKEKEWIWPALGLDPDRKWPVDPVVPTRLLIAVPREECEGLEETIKRSVEKAWKLILGGIIGRVREACERLGADKKDCPLLDDEIASLAREVEPPLGIRVLTVEWAKIQAGRLTKYLRALGELHKAEQALSIKAAGRRSGRRYLELAKKLYSQVSSGKVNPQELHCTMCGKAYSVVRARNIRLTGSSKEHRRLLAELGGENLCPYCLVKRLLRRTIKDDNRRATKDDKTFAEEIAGLRPSGRGLVWTSVWDHTARIQILREALQEDESLRELLTRGDLWDTVELIAIYYDLGWEHGRRPPLQPEERVPAPVTSACIKILGQRDDCAFLSSLLWTIIIELLQYPLAEAKKRLRPDESDTRRAIHEILKMLHQYDYISDAPARYAIVKADGDYMGKGLLSGRIPVSKVLRKACPDPLRPAAPEEYLLDGGVLTPPETMIEEVVEAYRILAGEIAGEVRGLSGGCGDDPVEASDPTLPVTPAYHATVSRSLAVVSALDRAAIEESGGQVVFLGGDDALAIAPPVNGRIGNALARGESPSDAEKMIRGFPALRIALKLRENWAGVPGLGGRPGFLAVVDKESRRVLHLAPAPGAYGRSVSVYMAGAKYPMWLSMAITGGLEEAKDGFLVGGESGEWRKDVLVLASETRGAVAVPLSLPGEGLLAGKWLRGIATLYRLVLEGVASKRILQSLPLETAMLVSGLRSLGAQGEAVRIVSAALARWSRREALISTLSREPGLAGACGYMLHPSAGSRDAATCLLAAIHGAMLGGEPCFEARTCLSRKLERLIMWEAVVERRRLVVHGIDFAANPYMGLFLVEGGERVRLPLLYAPFALAYVYESGLLLRRG